MIDTALRVISRFSLPTRIEAASVSSTPRREQNRNSAIITLSVVSAVRTLLRPRFTSTSDRSFTAARPSREHALVEVHHAMRALGGVRIVRDHDDGLLVLPVEALEELE